MKSSVQWNPVYIRKDLCSRWGSNQALLDQQAISKPNDLLGLLEMIKVKSALTRLSRDNLSNLLFALVTYRHVKN